MCHLLCFFVTDENDDSLYESSFSSLHRCKCAGTFASVFGIRNNRGKKISDLNIFRLSASVELSTQISKETCLPASMFLLKCSKLGIF